MKCTALSTKGCYETSDSLHHVCEDCLPECEHKENYKWVVATFMTKADAFEWVNVVVGDKTLTEEQGKLVRAKIENLFASALK